MTERSDLIIYTLISNNVATLKEIRDDYSMEEVLDLYEMVIVKIHNKYKSLEGSNGQLHT